MDQLTHQEILTMMEPVAHADISQIHNPPRLYFSVHRHLPQRPCEDQRPCVYAWVIGVECGAPEIIYVGKGGKGLIARFRQHEQGFRGKEGKGRSNGDKLTEYMADGRVDVFAMWPEPALFRSIPIPSHSAVEDWLLSAVEPPPKLNKEAAIRARAEAIAAGTHSPKARKTKTNT